MSAGAEGIELCYLGRLDVRVEAGRMIVDLGFAYAHEKLLAYDAWPAYTRTIADNAGALLAIHEPPSGGPWAAQLAIFRADSWTRPWSLIAMADGRLIVWEPGEKPDLLQIRLEREHAELMWALIRQAGASASSLSPA